MAVLGGGKGGDAGVVHREVAIVEVATARRCSAATKAVTPWCRCRQVPSKKPRLAPHTIVKLSKNRVVLARVGKN